MSAGHLPPERREGVLAALLYSKSHKAAADRAGVCERTLWRYKADPALLEELRALRAATFTANRTKLENAYSGALDALEEVISNPEGKGARLKQNAACAILAHALAVWEKVDLSAQVEAMRGEIADLRAMTEVSDEPIPE